MPEHKGGAAACERIGGLRALAVAVAGVTFRRVMRTARPRRAAIQPRGW
ncbi:MAG: hypothetical protein JOZ29_19500 [Deltaproteobacteria bacterium]|nr:hypothetical protein [Deltaproteobacteria bacterium]